MKVLIAGGGPSGATAAYWLASQGVEVTVLEKTSYPREKVCGDGLTPRAVREMQLMGLPHGPEHGYRSNKGLRIRARGRAIEVPWPSLTDFPAYGLVRSRVGFDQHLAEHARAQGAQVLERRSVTETVRDGDGRVRGLSAAVLDERGRRTGETERHLADLVLACDGVSSRTAVSAGLHRRRDRPMGVAVRTYYETPRSDLDWMEGWLELTDGTDPQGRLLPGYGWVFGVGDGTANVGLGILDTSPAFGKLDYKKVLADWAASMPEEWTFDPEHQRGRVLSAALPMAFNRTPHWIPGMMLLGDSAGLVSAFNGEGISNAMESARYAAEHILEAIGANGPAQREAVLARYPQRLAAEWGAHFTQGRLLAEAIGHPRIMKAALATGMSVPPLMRFVVQTMAELTDRPPRSWQDHAVAVLDALTPPTSNRAAPRKPGHRAAGTEPGAGAKATAETSRVNHRD
ncbi:geranylgeranyl reductase family protein [Kocuria coralli]|uniref:Geranylgeranyl reductase family protein n=1 Tax=Kocuria coralli TaxID=1461025 RepID=A0A5J5L0V5_9MICC|nr:geranylgeranyl reductase family protein [Kocuria coralli]KAA9395268.1 geranylgeranyl reductase family protein [Kocuria coralli]